MKKIFALFLIASVFFACSEDVMDEVNRDRNNAQSMDALNLLPDIIVKTFISTAATDLAWYATVFIEHNAGTWAQSADADRRVGVESASLLNNSWNQLYNVMNSSKTVMNMTDPATGVEPTNYYARGLAQILMAYNLATTTDFWGKVPYNEAFQGAQNLQPSYQNQSELYPIVLQLLDEGIENMGRATLGLGSKDLIFGHLALDANKQAWIKAAYSLKARYHLQLTNVSTNAAQNALQAAENGFTGPADQLQMDGFAVAFGSGNPWGEFWWVRDHLSVSSTFHEILMERNDPRQPNMYDYPTRPIAPIGEAQQTQGGYSQSFYTTTFTAWVLPVLVMTYHELLFIIAEAKFRTGAGDWMDALQTAVEAAFVFHNTEIGDYFETEVVPRLTEGNELREIMTQKYIAFFDREAIQAYNDYRRTGYPEMKNPNNATTGFPHRAPYPVSEVSSNPANVPNVNVFTDKVWWAGGTE